MIKCLHHFGPLTRQCIMVGSASWRNECSSLHGTPAKREKGRSEAPIIHCKGMCLMAQCPSMRSHLLRFHPLPIAPQTVVKPLTYGPMGGSDAKLNSYLDGHCCHSQCLPPHSIINTGSLAWLADFKLSTRAHILEHLTIWRVLLIESWNYIKLIYPTNVIVKETTNKMKRQSMGRRG